MLFDCLEACYFWCTVRVPWYLYNRFQQLIIPYFACLPRLNPYQDSVGQVNGGHLGSTGQKPQGPLDTGGIGIQSVQVCLLPYKANLSCGAAPLLTITGLAQTTQLSLPFILCLILIQAVHQRAHTHTTHTLSLS